MRNQLIETIKRTLIAIRDILPFIFQEPAYEQPPKDLPINQDPPTVPKEQLISSMLMSIQKHEGWYEGSRSWRNKNPGNLVYVGQPKATKEVGGRFAVFSTYQDGYNALKNMVLNAANGKSKVYRPNMTLKQFFATYAPVSDGNDSDHYANTVAKAMGVDANTFRLRDLL